MRKFITLKKWFLMRFNSKAILIFCILALYLERELACRNLGYWINNTNNTFLENLWLFSKPYHLVLITFYLVINKDKISTIPISLGIIEIIRTSYRFISREMWQYNHFEDYELFTPYDSLEIRTIFTICVKIIFYATAFWSHYKFSRSYLKTNL